jgi:hypothetical protein
MRAEETFTQRRRSDLELLVRGVQAGMPNGRHDAIEAAVGIAAVRQGLSKGDAVETCRRLLAEDRARFQAQHDKQVGLRLLGIAMAALDGNASLDVARARADEVCRQLGLPRSRMRRVLDKALADRTALAEVKRDRAARRRRA